MVSRLTRDIAFYRKYHRNPVNVGLHIVGIPTILLSSVYGLTAVRFFGSEYITVGLLMSLYYLYSYAKLDPFFGSLIGIAVVAASLAFAKLSAATPHYYLSWGLWTTGWVAQFIGHGVFEGRAPALFDNLRQALLLAPYFAVLEVAAFLGYEHARVEIAKVDSFKSNPYYNWGKALQIEATLKQTTSGQMWYTKDIKMAPRSEGIYLIENDIKAALPQIKEIQTGLLHLFVKHTSAGICLNENWDSDVRTDMLGVLNKLVPQSDSYLHNAEGPDDMPSHVKASLVGSSVTIPIRNGKLNVGTWQGIYLCEFRQYKHSRTIVATIQGE